MSLDNSTTQYPLPGDLQSRVENAQNLVTSLEAEEVRLSKLVNSYKLEINAIHTDMKSLELKVSGLRKEKTDLESNISDLNKEVASVTKEVIDARSELQVAKYDKEDVMMVVKSQHAELDKREAGIQNAEKDVTDRAAALTQKELKHQQKVDRLLAVIN